MLTRADLLRRAGRPEEARGAYERALAVTRNEAVHRFVTSRLASIRPTETS